jgi:hypothetical protein
MMSRLEPLAMTDTTEHNQPPPTAIARVAQWAAALLIPLSILIGDFEFRWVHEHAREPIVFWQWFLSSVGLSIMLWVGLITLVRHSKLRFVVLPLVVVPAGILIIASWRFRVVRHFDPAATVVAFIFDEPMYVMELASAGFSPGWTAAFILIPLGWLAVALYASSDQVGAQAPSPLTRALAATAVVAVPLSVWLGWPSVIENPWTPYPTDIRLLKIGEQGVGFYRAGASSFMVKPAKRDRVAPVVPKQLASEQVDQRQRPSVLVILGESVRNDRTQLWGTPGRQTTPRLAALERDHPDETFVFQRHTASAAATLAAGMGVLLGKYFSAPDDQLRRAPVIWQYAQAAGMETFLVSSQPWDWANLNGFYVEHQPPDHFYDSTRLGLDVLNDAGGDDLKAADKVVELISEDIPSDQPFMGVFQLNATHFPFHPSQDVSWPIEDTVARYDAALARTDAAIGEVFDALEHTGRLESTVVIFVSDHAIEVAGLGDARDHDSIRSQEPAMFQGARVSSCEPVFVRTPMLIFVPTSVQERFDLDRAQIAGNTRKLTSHVDVLPTVLDLWSIAAQTPLDGQSLLEPIGADRLVYCFPATRVPQLAGVGIQDEDRYVYLRANLSRAHVFDVDQADVFGRRRLGKTLDAGGIKTIEQACQQPTPARGVLERLKAELDLDEVSCGDRRSTF